MATVAQLDKIASFKPGFWKGKNYTAEYLKAAHDNFQKYSSGTNPYYVPFCNINHKDEYRHGEIVKTTIDADGTLNLWADNLPEFVGNDLKAGRLGERSIEFFEPTQINGKIDGFFDRDGKLVQTPVIRCLSWLGNESPAVKGLGPLPEPKFKAAKFNDRAVSRFSDKAKVIHMDQALLDQLKALDFPIETIPPDATDELLKAIIACAQAKNANPTPEPTPEPVVTNSDTTGTPAPSATGVPSSAPLATALQGTGMNPSQITTVTKFFDDFASNLRQQITGNVGDLNALRATNEAIVRNAKKQLEDGKRAAISRFFDECGIGKGKSGQITPAMQKTLEPLLMLCDNSTVRKFSDGKTDGTALEEKFSELRKTLPVVRGGQSIKQPTPANPNDGNRSGNRERILSGSVYGQTILKKEKELAAKK